MSAHPVRRGPGKIGTSKEAGGYYSISADDWLRACTEKTRIEAEMGSERLLNHIERTGQKLPPELPRRRLTFAEQLALVASGKARIIDLDVIGGQQ